MYITDSRELKVGQEAIHGCEYSRMFTLYQELWISSVSSFSFSSPFWCFTKASYSFVCFKLGPFSMSKYSSQLLWFCYPTQIWINLVRSFLILIISEGFFLLFLHFNFIYSCSSVSHKILPGKVRRDRRQGWEPPSWAANFLPICCPWRQSVLVVSLQTLSCKA